MSGLSLLHERLDQHLELSASIGQVFDDKSKSIKMYLLMRNIWWKTKKVLYYQKIGAGEVRGSIKDRGCWEKC